MQPKKIMGASTSENIRPICRCPIEQPRVNPTAEESRAIKIARTAKRNPPLKSKP